MIPRPQHKSRKIGFFGGTFDPIHFGHLNLAIEIKEKKELDEIWFSPAFLSPFREEAPPISPMHRIEMVKLAIATAPFFHCYEKEGLEKAISYTIDAMAMLKKEFPNDNFFLILGEDCIPFLHEWKDSFILIREMHPLIGCRKGFNTLETIENLPIPHDLKNELKSGLVLTKVMEISATEIRDRLKKRLYCHHLVPSKVLDYIERNQLYF